MARSGLYKSDVKKARDSLIAQGTNPSVDAVRVALGNTGSKTTIHKYLKELEEDGDTGDRKTSISDSIQDLVERLAARLQEEASAQVEALRADFADQVRKQADAVTAEHREVEQLTEQLRQAIAVLEQERSDHQKTRAALQQESITRHTAEQHAIDLKDRLAENEAHRLSLEQKHLHAREALEHYRASVKEQREQDQRRHEQQIQQLQAELRQVQQSVIVKQDEVTRLNQEGARILSDLSHAQKALYDEQTSSRRMAHKIEELQAVSQRVVDLDRQMQERDLESNMLKRELATSIEKNENLNNQVRAMELALAQAQAKIEVQERFMSELRVYLGDSVNTGAKVPR